MSAAPLYKAIPPSGRERSYEGAWDFPQSEKPGDWMPPKDHGYRLVYLGGLIDRLAPTVFEAEGRDVIADNGTVAMVRQARLVRRLEGWNDVNARRFAVDCVANILPMLEPRRLLEATVIREVIAVSLAVAEGRSPQIALGPAYDRAASAEAGNDGPPGLDLGVGLALDAARNTTRGAAWAAAKRAAIDAVSAVAAVGGRPAGAATEAWQCRRLLQYLKGEVT